MDEKTEIANQLAHVTFAKHIRTLFMKFEELENVLELYEPENHIRYLKAFKERYENDEQIKEFDKKIKEWTLDLSSDSQ